MRDDDEAKELYEKYSVAGSGKVLFQAASANLNPWTEDKVDTENPERGPMLILAGEKDHTVPHAIANASFKHELRNDGVTEIIEIEGRGHSLTIDSGWREVCDKALAFVKRFVSRAAGQPCQGRVAAWPAHRSDRRPRPRRLRRNRRDDRARYPSTPFVVTPGSVTALGC